MPLTSVQSIRRLTPQEAAEKRPVRITGVITFANADAVGDFFVQDSTAGIYVTPTTLALGLAAGDRVEVEGVSDPGDFAPCVVASDVRRLERRVPLPTALPYNLAAEDSRWLDGQLVQVWGVVSEVSAGSAHTVLKIYSAHGKATVRIPDPKLAVPLAALVNVAVKFQAVSVPSFDTKERMIRQNQSRLYTNAIPMVELSATAAQHTQAIDHLLRFNPSPHPGARRVIITGVVVGQSDTGTVYVQDATGGVAAIPEIADTAVRFGDKVEVTGLVAIEGRRVQMLRAVLAVIGPGTVPEPTAVTLADLTKGLHYAVRVSTSGRVDDVVRRDGHVVMTLVEGASRIDVQAPADLTTPLVGSRIRVVGAHGRANPYGHGTASSTLWLQSPADLEVLQVPPPPRPEPWWTQSRIVAIVGSIAGVAIFALFWVLTLRRQVQRQTDQLRQRFEAEAQLEDKLRTARKLESLGRLAGGIAHDFNNLLTVINGCGELLHNDLPSGSVQRELVADIRGAGEKAASLVSQLLLFSRQQAVRMTAIDLIETVRDTERILSRIIGEKITVICEMAPDTPPVKAEETLIQQIILNLAVNARDAMPNGGTLLIRTGNCSTARGVQARLTVSDTGTGMDDATRARIFEPFFTTKGVGEGTGLGLATVYGIVQTLGGEIHCQSAPGAGTTFEIDLPCSDSTSQALDDPPPILFMKGRGRVLLAEDDAAVRELTGRILETAGYEVLSAETPTVALTIAAEYDGRIDLLLTDMVMPELNGRELARKIQPLRPEMQVLFMSGYSDDEYFRNDVETDAIVLIGKPFTPAALTAKVGELLRHTLPEFSGPSPVSRAGTGSGFGLNAASPV